MRKKSPFSKSHFTYDKEQDCYFVPRTQIGYEDGEEKGTATLRINQRKAVSELSHYGQCTTSKADGGLRGCITRR